MIRAKFSTHACRTARKALIHVYAYFTYSNACAHSTSDHAGVCASVHVCARACMCACRMFVAVVLSPGAARRHPACFPLVENFEAGGIKSWRGHAPPASPISPQVGAYGQVASPGGPMRRPPSPNEEIPQVAKTHRCAPCPRTTEAFHVRFTEGLGIVCWGYGLVREVKPYASPPPDPGSRVACGTLAVQGRSPRCESAGCRLPVRPKTGQVSFAQIFLVATGFRFQPKPVLLSSASAALCECPQGRSSRGFAWRIGAVNVEFKDFEVEVLDVFKADLGLAPSRECPRGQNAVQFHLGVARFCECPRGRGAREFGFREVRRFHGREFREFCGRERLRLFWSRTVASFLVVDVLRDRWLPPLWGWT